MGNPIIRHKFTADPTVIEYNGTVYLYTGHDDPPLGIEDYRMNEWLCFSSKDLIDWKEHSVPLSPADFTWAKADAFASKVVFCNQRFYWYVAVSHAGISGKAIGVAVSNEPSGPFKDAKGAALITQDMIPDKNLMMVNLDPTVIIDEAGQGHIFWGNSICYYAKLKANMIELDGPIETITLPGFTEGAHIHERDGWYYLSYGFEFPEKVAYAMSQSIHGPWEFKGILNDIADNCQTNRPAVLDFKGKSYFFYHNGALRNGGSHRRSVCIDYLYYNEDHTIQPVIMTSAGIQKSP